MNFKRYTIAYLKGWKVSKNRKPLILRGARQVGKTTLVKEFAKTYKHHIFMNLEKSADAAIWKERTIHTPKEYTPENSK